MDGEPKTGWTGHWKLKLRWFYRISQKLIVSQSGSSVIMAQPWDSNMLLLDFSAFHPCRLPSFRVSFGQLALNRGNVKRNSDHP